LVVALEVGPVGDHASVIVEVPIGWHSLTNKPQHQVGHARAEDPVERQIASGGWWSVGRPRWRAARYNTTRPQSVRHLTHERVDPLQGGVEARRGGLRTEGFCELLLALFLCWWALGQKLHVSIKGSHPHRGSVSACRQAQPACRPRRRGRSGMLEGPLALPLGP
jgi:hypothetical protein